ncbi:MAG: glycosyltransferase family 39 protein [Chitinophagaceae bacterium]
MPTRFPYLIIALGAALLFLPFLGHVHLFDWDEINFAECAREMIVSKDYLRMQIDFMPFYEKPPLFIWMQVLSMKALGINAYAARLPDALTGIASLLSLFYIGRRVANDRIAWLWTILYAATWLPHLYFKSGIIDPVFNFFIFLAFFQVYLLRWGKRPGIHALLAGLFIGLAVLTKGPVAIVIAGLSLVVYLILNRGFKGFRWLDFFIMGGVALLTIGLWFGVEYMQHGPTFLKEFIAYQAGLFSQNIADHAEPWYYHPIVLLVGCFPASLFLFQYGKKDDSESSQTKDFKRWMWILFWVVLILFSIVKTKIVHYSSLCYFPLTFLAAIQIQRLIEQKAKLRNAVLAGLLVIGTIFGLLITALPLVGIFKGKIIPYIADPFAVANLQANVPWHWTECLWGGIYLCGFWICLLGMRHHFKKYFFLLCGLQLLIIQVALTHFAPKVEAYTQRAAVEYFQGFIGKDVYLHTLGYKSYAVLFYSQKQKSENPSYYHTAISGVGSSPVTEANEQWLLYGQLDKPAYFISKITDAPQWRRLPNLEEIGEKNGFVFFKRR